MDIPFFKTFFYGVWLIINLIIEIFAAMLVYIYLDLYHRDFFGQLVGVARELLNSFTANLQAFTPEFANQANTSLIGELGAKSILLLVIGLIVSALLRSLTMILFSSIDRARIRSTGDPEEREKAA